MPHSPLGIPFYGPPVPLDARIHDTSKIPFVPHTDPIMWLGLELNYSYIQPIFEDLNKSSSNLQSRGEAHITVISPPEYEVLAKVNISIDDINTIAAEHNIQASKFRVICLGKAELQENSVYQLIVSSPDLVDIRTKLFQLYWSKGGNTALFDPKSFWPHITVGFTEHDLFLENGVFKGDNLCWRSIELYTRD
ncbi:hypothetical protein INT44_008404 [Umbelopsis vinacea]|uniref:Swiss Army Knife 2H phosphoesterase domain-containing protein n=1 Tax=Umbelopsis vinacea TaxID=44442 RepID=A0A8H7PVW2_9FUNG|nr:hypothetical protein INT44_008404 [Umbelopsis vinacea]